MRYAVRHSRPNVISTHTSYLDIFLSNEVRFTRLFVGFLMGLPILGAVIIRFGN